MNDYDVGLFKLKPIQLPNGGYNTFFYLNQSDVPNKFLSVTNDIVPLQLRFGDDLDSTFYTSLGPFVAQVPRNYIGACPTTIQRLGLKENDEIFVTIRRAKSLSVVTVLPKRQDDYQIMVSARGVMEQIILNQVRVVAPRQTLTLQIGSVVIDFIVEHTKPSMDYGRLEPHTEVVISDPATSKTEQNSSTVNYVEENTVSDVIWKAYKWGMDYFRTEETKNEKVEKEKSSKEILMDHFRMTKDKPLEYRVVRETEMTSDNYIYTSNGFQTNSPTPCKITKIREYFDSEEKEKPEVIEPFYCLLVSRETNDSCEIYLHDNLMKMKNLTIGSRLVIEPLSELPPDAKITSIKEPIKNHSKIFCWKNLKELRQQILQSIDCTVKTGFVGNVLVTGPPGCGKTYLMNEILRKCFQRKIYCVVISCKSLRFKKVEPLLKILGKTWSECSFKEPSVLILDDLDALSYVNQEIDDKGFSKNYGRRISSLIIEHAEWFAKKSRIQIIATAFSVSHLGINMASVRGPRLFSIISKIPELSKNEFMDILKHFEINLAPELLEKMHGFRVQDLADLASRAKLRAHLDGRKEVKTEDVAGALEDTVPRALQGNQMQVEIPYTWNDVGGMDKAKKSLIEIFRWPSKYPEIFSSSPLKLQTGALLYGPPGCGKTLIAGALANECGMNFKSVKGPELLNKYIGQSEAAVRNLFESASQAQPCLLFFDELDSLAPRRGADSTGVTDRVVNQLLTELDGVEGCSGVWVLGATSRPDLIDPALLRPGRLDRVVFCDVPTFENRKEILQVLSKNLKFADNVDIDDLATRSEGFTGADLQSFLYNCQMKAVKDCPNCHDELVVTCKHVDAALRESRMSLSTTEKLKYEKIYERFKSARGNALDNQVQKVTLA